MWVLVRLKSGLQPHRWFDVSSVTLFLFRVALRPGRRATRFFYLVSDFSCWLFSPLRLGRPVLKRRTARKVGDGAHIDGAADERDPSLMI